MGEREFSAILGTRRGPDFHLARRRMRPKPDEQYDVYEVDVTGEEADGDILDYDDIDDPEAFG